MSQSPEITDVVRFPSIYAWLAINERGEEGVISTFDADGSFLLLSSALDDALTYKHIASNVAAATQAPVRLARFDHGETIAIIKAPTVSAEPGKVSDNPAPSPAAR